MTKPSSRPRNVYIGLVVVTVISLAVAGGAAHGLLTARVAATTATVLAFAKARFVVLDFMELRHAARVRSYFDAWLAVVCLGCAVLLLR
ncbi:cytochrome C oxidase subunit IV family protein [Haloechinothrix sp. YIM 98757]|uniref:Cytochrome C oxidase subunit IV family protein n=1 Tax=Haloechinothrix aidingensis TaxID=2752311 RepID=A0A838ACD2_9PSEU|nr:cytochrome C oxidase subunit IV family protein [Haloechinothrix aidingensis]MBA0126845.1 cytochrome C oxidase subunit IV family protein [Haloechinothrix aidingensis]